MSKGTTRRSVRIDDPLWEAAMRKSDRTGVDISSVVRKKLEEWIAEGEGATNDVPNR